MFVAFVVIACSVGGGFRVFFCGSVGIAGGGFVIIGSPGSSSIGCWMELSSMGTNVGSMGGVAGSMGAIMGSMGAVVGSMGSNVGSMGGVAGSMGSMGAIMVGGPAGEFPTNIFESAKI